MLSGKSISYLVVAICFSGCADITYDGDIQRTQLEALTTNALTTNALTTNALTTNALTTNALTTNALTTNGLVETDEGRELLTYIARCSLRAGDSVSVVVDGREYEFPGSLGLAPDWTREALGAKQKELLSACLLAHVNLFGVSVPLSVRSAKYLATGEDEASRFLSYEATFYGDLFSKSGGMFVCGGDAAPSFEVTYPNHDTTAGDRLLRRCADPTEDDATRTECGFTYVGSCDEVCDAVSADGHRQCWTSAERSGRRYNYTVSAWQLAYDDSESVWPELYEAVYGN